MNINNTTNNKFFSPNIFKIILGLCSEKFEGNEQEDAHEFINYLLDILHEDLNKITNSANNKDKNQNIKFDNKRQYSDEEKSIIDWSNFLRRNQSVLIDLFYGQLKSCVTCPNCNFSSINFNTFLSLELSINSNKNYNVINIEFIDYYSESPNINFSIILYNEENKIYFVRKKIANLLNIDLLSFELAFANEGNIIHLCDLNDEINSDIKCITAYRINPEFFYSTKNGRYNEIINNEKNNANVNIKNKYKIDFENLERNVNKRRNEIIKYNESNNRNINDDFLSLNLLYSDNIGLKHSDYHRLILENFVVKNRHMKNFAKDDIIYLDKNKTCNEIYFEIFKKYVLNIVFNYFPSEKRNRFCEIYNSEDKEKRDLCMKKIFFNLFKKVEIHPSRLDIINNFPHCPFLLFLNNHKYGVKEIIPVSNDINYQDILNIYNEGINFEKNKYNQIRIYNSIKKNGNSNNNKEKEENKEEDNDNIGLFGDFISNILNDKDKDDNNDSKKETKKGLKGGNENQNDSDKEEANSDSGGDSEETDENNNENQNSDTNSEREINMLDEENLGTNSYEYNNSPNISPKRNLVLEEKEFENLLQYKNEKDENMDRLTIVWNGKYMKEISRFRDINLYDICDKIYEKSTSQEMNLLQLFEEFSKEEKLDKDNLYNCDNCKEQLEANKKIEIYHLPKILIIHLKRFNNNKKINTLIDYPLTDLDINKFIKSNDNVAKYDLYGVINHFGSLEYGHYTSFCLNYHDNIWYEYNDRIVNKIEKEKETIINKNAYILFYKAQDIDKINWDAIYKKQYELIDENNLKKFGENLIYYEENKEIEDMLISQIPEQEINEDKSEKILLEEKNIDNNNINDNGEIDDDNFSFKEGMNTKNNITNESGINNENGNNPNEETPKFKNRSKNINDIKGDLINFNLNEGNNTNIKEENDTIKGQFKTEVKKDDFLNGIKITHSNTLRINTFIKPKRKETNNTSPITKNLQKEIQLEPNYDKSSNNENELLKYDIFNQKKNYFKLNPNKSKRGIQSVKNKELNLFFLQEISDNLNKKVPHSKKLYDEIPIKPEENNKNQELLNNTKDDENTRDINNKEINLDDYVYNPFKNCYAKLKKF